MPKTRDVWRLLVDGRLIYTYIKCSEILTQSDKTQVFAQKYPLSNMYDIQQTTEIIIIFFLKMVSKRLNKYKFELVPFTESAIVLFMFSFTAQIDQIGCIILTWLSGVFDFGKFDVMCLGGGGVGRVSTRRNQLPCAL